MKSSLLAALAIIAFLIGSGCQPTTLTLEQFNRYVVDPDNGLQQQQQVGETAITVTYQPAELLVAREVQAEAGNATSLDSLRRQYGQAAYFLLAISRHDQNILQPTEGFAHYSELLQTLAFHLDEHVRLITSQNDTIRPANYYLDRTAGTSASQMILAFPMSPSAAAGIWRFQLLECGLGTGDLTFSFNTQQLRAVPALAVP